jgi:hypothetical protein
MIPLQLVLVHLAVGHGHPGLGDGLADLVGDPVDGVDPVVDEEGLALAEHLAADGVGHRALVVGADEGQHRVALLGRGLHHRQVADAGDGHLHGPGDRGGGQGEHVDLGPELLEVLLVADPEAVLLVDHDQAQVGPLGVGRQQPVGADDHVDGAVGHAGDDLLLLLRDWKRDSTATLTGKGANRSEKTAMCCWASRVVGTSTPTCLPSMTALKAARTATSVLP